MRDDETDTEAPAGPAPRSRGRPDGRGELDTETQRRLGRALRTHYADLLNAPVPDRFAALLAGLEAAAAGGPAPPDAPAVEPTGQEDAR